jgi:5-(carboxyamino)imidazole ribonucleotide mutase
MPTVSFLLGSKVDTDFAKKIAVILDEFGVSSEIIVASAHKVPEKVVQVIEKLNARTEPTVVVTCVGMSNGLGGVVAGSCVHPVVNCPPHADLSEYMVDIHSSLRMPSDVPVMTVCGVKNAAIATLRILGESDKALQKKLIERIKKIKAEY